MRLMTQCGTLDNAGIVEPPHFRGRDLEQTMSLVRRITQTSESLVHTRLIFAAHMAAAVRFVQPVLFRMAWT